MTKAGRRPSSTARLTLSNVAFHDAFNRRDIEGHLALCHPAVEYWTVASVATGERYHEGAMRRMRVYVDERDAAKAVGWEDP